MQNQNVLPNQENIQGVLDSDNEACLDCHSFILTPKKFKSHFKNCHGGFKFIYRHTCGFGFANKIKYQKHLVQKHNDNAHA